MEWILLLKATPPREQTATYERQNTGASYEDTKALPESRNRKVQCTAQIIWSFLKWSDVNCLKTEAAKRQHSRREQLNLQHMTKHGKKSVPPWENNAPIQIETKSEGIGTQETADCPKKKGCDIVGNTRE